MTVASIRKTDTALQPTLRSARALVAAGLIQPERQADAARVAERYAVAVSPAMANLIDPTDPADPIARQFLPDTRELESRPGESADPIGDALKSPIRGLVHRYRDRVLLKVTGVCPVYCRFCFRREMVGPGKADDLSAGELASALAYIAERPAIWEVILTGGDPLILSPRRIAELTEGLANIGHVRVLRWHSRVPVVAPERVTEELVGTLASGGPGRTVVVGVHANHARELTADARAALRRLTTAGILLVSQSVLLKGINDDADALEALMRGFVQAGVKPYYLHHPDRAPGTGHFRITIAEGQALMTALRQRLSGLALPTYVLDIPGAHGKVPVEAANIVALAPGRWRVTDRDGRIHAYDDED